MKVKAVMTALLTLGLAGFLSAQDCVECHRNVTPNIVSDWELSRHSQNEVDCSSCHGERHEDPYDVREAAIPTPETCAACHDAPTPIEQKLFVMFLEHRMRAFQGTFHANPDYSLWYGWSEMVRDLADIKSSAEEMRQGPR